MMAITSTSFSSRVRNELHRAQLEIAARFRCFPGQARPKTAAGPDMDTAALKRNIRRMKLGQLARQRQPADNVQAVTPREFSFERLHPALADAHHLRTRAKDEKLHAAQQAVQRHPLDAQARTPRRQAAGSPAADAPLPVQLPDWDRVANLGEGTPASPVWRPVSPTGKRVAPPDIPSPSGKRQHVAKARAYLAGPALRRADTAAEEKELQARIAALKSSIQMLEGSSRGADEHGSAAAESDASEFLPARLLWAHEAEGSAADYHNYGAGHRLSREASSSEEREELVSELGEGLVGQDGVTHAPQQVHQAPIADWWEDGRGNREQESAAAAVLSEWLHDYLCEADGTEASAKYLALLASSAQRNAALAACHSQEPGRPQPAVCSRDQTGRERQAMRHSSLRQPAGSAQQHQPQAKESIRERRLRGDLEQRAAEEAAELAFRFQATPLPQSTAEPRHALIRTQQAQRVAEARAQQQRAQQGAAFSFVERDVAGGAARAAAAAERERLQKRALQPFRAHPVPAYIRKAAKEHRWRRAAGQGQEAEVEPEKQRQGGGWDRAVRWRGSIGSTAAEENSSATAYGKGSQGKMAPKRAAVSARLYNNPFPSQRGAQVSEVQSDPSQQVAAGTPVSSPWPDRAIVKARKVPDFAALHAAWARRLAAAKAAVEQALTVPQAFRLTKKRKAAVQAESAHTDCGAAGESFSVRRTKSEAGRWRPEAPDLAQARWRSEHDLSRLDALNVRARWKAQLLAQKIARIKQACIGICAELGLPCRYLDAPTC